MKKIIVAVILLAGCGQSEIEKAQQAVAQKTREPAAAQFQNVTYCSGDPRIIVGKVNAKNGFGGYVGFTTFYVDRGVVTVADEVLLGNAEGRRFVAGLVDRCGQAEV